MATNQITSWLITVAQRQYEFISGPNQGSSRTIGQQSAKSAHTSFMLIDSGYDSAVAGAFSDFKPGVQANVEKFMHMGYPAIRRRSSETHDSLQIFVNQRFILRIEAENQGKDAALSWARQVQFQRYQIPRTALMTSLPAEVMVVTVDELNPANNHESKTTIGRHIAVPR